MNLHSLTIISISNCRNTKYASNWIIALKSRISITTRFFCFRQTTKQKKLKNVAFLIHDNFFCSCSLSNVLLSKFLFFIFMKYTLIFSVILIFQFDFKNIFIQFFIDKFANSWSIYNLKYFSMKFVKAFTVIFDDVCIIISFDKILCFVVDNVNVILWHLTMITVYAVMIFLNHAILGFDLKWRMINSITFVEFVWQTLE